MPSSFDGLLDTWVDAWAATAGGVTDCVRTGTRIAPWPLDLGRWMTVANARRPPGWSSPHEIVFEAPLARLRDFSAGPGRGVVPTLVLPPQAGHDSCIVDYSAQQSQMRTIVQAGLTRAFTLDWAAATRATADSSIEDYLDVIDRAVDHCGGRVNLIGDCQGGWLATIYAALAPQRINTLTIAGAPIDFHAGEPVIGEVIRWLAPNGDLRFYEALVASGRGVLKGRHMLSGFIMIQPGAEISRQLELLCNLGDAEHVARYKEFEDWFKHTQDIPGALYLWAVRNLFRDNALIAGKLEVRGSRVKLGSLTMPLNLLAGASDHITPPAQVFALADHAGTAADDIQRRISSGGHLGLFMGREALAEHWPPLLARVADHSRTSTSPRSSPARR
jgi:poly(3-hydroxybutyrate) depolymerase